MTTHRTEVITSGTVVHIWSAGPRRGVAVLQHGFGEYAERYLTEHSALVGQLLDAGLDVFALDLWGHGRSPGARGAVHVGRAVADHLVVRRLAALTGVPVVLLGHSLGGLVTAGSVVADPTGAVGAVLLSPALPPALPQPVRRLLGAVTAVVPRAPLPQPRRSSDELSRVPEVGQRAAADPLLFHRQVPLLLAATAVDVAAQVRRASPSWSVPTLVMHGEADTYTDPADSRNLTARMPPTVAELHLIDRARHELLGDLCAAQVLTTVLQWIERRTKL